MKGENMNIEKGHAHAHLEDDDGRGVRKGTLVSASAHVVTAVIGSGVLSLVWATAQLGWIAGPVILLFFAFMILYTSSLLADSYRDPVTGKRNYTYKECVRSILGGKQYKVCAVAQYINLIGVAIGYCITAAISMAAVGRAVCFHKHGHEAGCHTENNKYMIIYAVLELVLSQIPNFHELSILSVIAAITSFGYAGIGLALALIKVIAEGPGKTTLTGVVVGVDVTKEEKVWNMLTSVGNLAFAYGFSMVFVEIQDTLKSSPPENVVMKKATTIGIFITTIFYLSCGLLGYAAFGNNAPGNFLTGFGFYEPYWLVAIANVLIVIHLVGAFQMFAQPIFDFVEIHCAASYPDNEFMAKEYILFGGYKFKYFRLIWRTAFVIFVALIAMLFPFFNDFMGLLGAFIFWPLTVYFPVEMYIVRENIQKYSTKWIMLRILSFCCLLITLAAASASLRGLILNFGAFKPFHYVS